MAFLVGGANSASGGYEIDNSLRYNNPDDPSLAITFGSAGNRKTFTISAWIKRGNIADNRSIFGQGTASNPRGLFFLGDQQVRMTNTNDGSSNDMDIQTNALLRDPSAFYHVVAAIDVTQSTDTNRVKIYINGELQTSFATSTYPAQNTDLHWNNDVLHAVGRYPPDDAQHWDGYISEFYFIDGTQYAASDFGETNDDGVWIPKDAKGALTFGDNGFYLEFKQTGTGTAGTGTIGADTSGEGNHLTSTNLAATDIAEDTPTNNFCTINPLATSRFSNQGAISEGNLKYDGAADDRGWGFSSMGVTKGKWYWEVKATATDRLMIGVGYESVLSFGGTFFGNNPSRAFSILSYNGNLYYDGANTAYGGTFEADDIMMVALDMDNHLCWFGENGTWSDSATQSEIENSTATNDATTQMSTQQNLNSGEFVFPFVTCQENSLTGAGIFNFGNPPFAISSGNSDDNGYGNFEYDVPTGFYALCTKNLAEFG